MEKLYLSVAHLPETSWEPADEAAFRARAAGRLHAAAPTVPAFSDDDLNPTARILPISAKTGEGMAAWADWLRAEVNHWKTQ